MPDPIDITIPSLGESVSEATIAKWTKADGDLVGPDDLIAELETDKATVELPANHAGTLKLLVPQGATVKVGDTVARIDPSNAGVSPAVPVATSPKPAVFNGGANVRDAATVAHTPPSPPPSQTSNPKSEIPVLDDLSPAVRALVVEHKLQSTPIPATGPGGRLTKDDVLAFLASPERQSPDWRPTASSQISNAPTSQISNLKSEIPPTPSRPLAPGEEREELSKLRQTLARRLVEAQHVTASLTTFNEVDLSAVIALREKYKESFEKLHSVGLGFMSFFAKAVIYALQTVPQVNYSLDGTALIKRHHVNLGVAVSTDRGLMVPVIRNAQNLSMAQIESEIKRLAAKARDGKITVDDMTGGTFTITNGGVFGSLLSTPILNPPQAAILGMHKIEKRPIVVQENGKDVIAIRPMMYLALTYDHRLVDGRQSVSFLVKVKEALEDPSRILLEV